MLMLTRLPGESVEIGDNVTLVVESIRRQTGENVKLISFRLYVDNIQTEISHRVGEIFYINSLRGYQISVLLAETQGYQIKLGIDAPRQVRIYRGELAAARRDQMA